MEIPEYKSNSHKSKEQNSEVVEREKMEKVVSGTVKIKKKSGFRKFFSDIIAEEGPDLKNYIVKDIVIPSVKKAISDTIDMILYGDSRRGSRTNASKISYRSYYDRSYDDPRPRNDGFARSGYSFEDIILESRGAAEQVISQMEDLIDTYGMVSVADLYDLVGISCDYTGNKYGWTNVRNAEVVRTRDGYMLKMPKALPIK
mgnify:CR=1 FL=1